MRRRLSRRVAWMALGLAVTGSARAEKETLSCIDANAAAQELERAGSFRAATQKLVACSREACPSEIRADCAQILARITAAQPTMSVVVRDGRGRDVPNATARIDGQPLPIGLGRAFDVDPGAHVLAVIAGATTTEQRVIVASGEKDRLVEVVVHVPPPVVRRGPFRVPWLSWALLGASAASLGAFAYFGVTGDGIKNRLDTSCKASLDCSPTEYSNMATTFIAADVFAGVAGLAFAGAIVSALLWPRAAVRVEVGAGFIGAAGHF